MDCSLPGFPVHHQLPELAQTHVHCVSDASNHLILYRPLLFLPSIYLSISIFSSELALCIRWPKYWIFNFSTSPSNEYSGLISFKIELVWSPCSPSDSPASSPEPQFESTNSWVLSLLYDPTLKSIHDYWKNHSFDYTNCCWQSNVSAFKCAV